MNEVCKVLNPDADADSVCTNWFRQACGHCMDLILHPKCQGIWSSVKNYFFQEPDTSLAGTSNTLINLQPTYLTPQDCEALFMDVLYDYSVKAPRFAIESAMNAMLWRVLISLMGALTIGHFLILFIYAYYKYIRNYQNNRPPIVHVAKNLIQQEQRMCAVANRSLRLARCELRLLKVKRLIQKEELLIPDGSPVLVLFVSSKLHVIDNVITRTVQGVGRLYRTQDEHIVKNKAGFKNQPISKALGLVDQFPRKLRFVLLFDDVSVYKKLLRQNRDKILSLSSSVTSKKHTTTILSSLNQRLARGGTTAPLNNPSSLNDSISSISRTTPRIATPKKIIENQQQQKHRGITIRSVRTPKDISHSPLSELNTKPAPRTILSIIKNPLKEKPK